MTLGSATGLPWTLMDDRYGRRHLLGMLALGVASVLTGCAPPTTSPTTPTRSAGGGASTSAPSTSMPPIPAPHPGAGHVVFHGPTTDRRIVRGPREDGGAASPSRSTALAVVSRVALSGRAPAGSRDRGKGQASRRAMRGPYAGTPRS
jgi:hypothetical protein